MVITHLGFLAVRGVGVTRPGVWPKHVYGVGEEPDYRVSLANERTFLAWIRTSVGLMAGGVAVATFLPSPLMTVLATMLVVLGLGCALSSWVRWARTERALRTGEPLPSAALTAWLAGGVAVIAVILVVALL